MARVAPQPSDAAPVEAAFFFGTLMHPRILRRVIGNNGTHLHASDAILHGYTRHHVRNADYPAIVPAKLGQQIMKKRLTPDEMSVRGTLVTGLTREDLDLLDEFEGDEYGRDVVEVQRVGEECGVPPIRAWAYVWECSPQRLAPDLWSFEDFTREKLSRWVQGDDEYAEVDRRRAMNGHITPSRASLGHAARDFWRFDPGWRNLNHGSYGCCPAPVIEAQRQIQNEIEAAPDMFLKRKLAGRLIDVRKEVAGLVHCDLDEIMVVPNVTTAIDSILRSLRWSQGESILHFSTLYKSCRNIIEHLIDSRPEMGLSTCEVMVKYPISDDDLLEAVEDAIKSAGSKRIRVALFDAITSVPAVRVPWERLVQRLRRDRILSLVDAAHALGNLDLDLRAVDPDFFVSNAHKHLFAPRPCAVLFVPRRNQPLVHSMPIGDTYTPSSTAEMPMPSSSLVSEWAWTGSYDWSGFLSLSKALDFRRQLGGEDAIMTYTRQLAVSGGQEVAKLLGTEVLENKEQSLTTSMVNVRLPIPNIPKSAEELTLLAQSIANKLMDDFDTHIQIFAYESAIWARFTAQVYLEIEDFRYGGESLQRICASLDENGTP